MRRALILGGLAAVGLRATGWAQPALVLAQASRSVLKIDAGSHTASGFLWPDADHVVTALHVVDNATRVVGHFVDAQGRIEASYPLRVARVLRHADLVLLRLPTTLPREPLRLSPAPPAVKQALDALGFPLNIPGMSSTEVRLRFGSTQLRSILPPKVLPRLGEYPSAALEVLNLEGNLVPGLSGAPLLDATGRVAGIANGGLEEGALGLCWGVPASQLEALWRSADTVLPGAPRVRELFAADLQADVRTLPPLAGVTLTKLRTRSFGQLAATADDRRGLAQLAAVMVDQNPEGLRFDIYQDLALGATVAVPEGWQLLGQGDRILVLGETGPRMAMVVQIRPARGIAEAQPMSEDFERTLTQYDMPGYQVVPDTQWSYPAPLRAPGGLIVNRKAAQRLRLVGGRWQREAYFFGTVAANDRAFLGVAARNLDDSEPTNLLETQCWRGLAHPLCPLLLAQRRAWAWAALAAQFSTFPPL